MRPFFVLCLPLAMLAIALGALAQTNTASSSSVKAAKPFPVTAIVSSNTITFPVLLSRDSEPLMTNAVFHRTFGRKVIFGADLSVQAFDVDQLHPSVIAQLDLDPDQLKAAQLNLDEQYQQWLAHFRQGVQKLLAANPTTAGSSTNFDLSATNSTPATNSTNHHVHYRYARSSAGHKTTPKTTRAD